MSLMKAEMGKRYAIQKILTADRETDRFLLSLGCYQGAEVTVLSRRRGSLVVLLKNGRYSIDRALADAVLV